MNPRIVIVGFMGCGKTTVAAEVARRLSCEFIDLDSFIAERERRTAAEIITTDGESEFRRLETAALREVLLDRSAVVIALGGGTWTIPANRALVAQHDCVSIWLDTPFDTCWQRISAGQTARPLAPDRVIAQRRYQSRQPDYALANHRMTASESDSAQTLADQVLRRTRRFTPENRLS